MRSDLISFQLGQRCSVKSSKRIFAKEYVEKGIPFMRSKDVIDKALGSFVSYDLFISEERYNEIKEKHGSPNKGDLLISSVGNRSGQSYIVQDEGDFYFKDGNILWLSEFKDINPYFLAYWFSSNKGQKTLSSMMIGSAQKALTIDSIRKLNVNFPKLHLQNKAVQILRSIDKKIELNRKMNQTLEDIAQSIFKSWFVDFDPVHEKTKYTSAKELEAAAKELGISKEILDLFPSEFDESELGIIPKGWSWKTFGDIIVPKRGKTITKKTVIEGDIPVVAGGLSPAYYHNQYNVEAPAITISASGANAGFVNLYNENIWASDCSYINHTITDYVYSTYLFLKHKQYEITRMQQGAAQPHIYPKDLMRLIVADCGSDLWSLLEKTIMPLFEKIANNEKENQTLQKTRDTLLPKLLSGELDVSELDLGTNSKEDKDPKYIFDIYKEKFGESFDIYGLYWDDMEKQTDLAMQCIEEGKVIWDILSNEELELIEEAKQGNIVF